MGRENDRLAKLLNGVGYKHGVRLGQFWRDPAIEKEIADRVARQAANPPPPPPPVVARPPIVRKGAASRILTADQPNTKDPAREAVENLKRWRAKPWEFVREVLGATPDIWQDEALHALPDHQRLAIKACKGPGKSAFDAWVVLWFLTCFSHPKILCTSITGDNLRDGLWAEIAFWMHKSPMLEALFEWQTERVFSKTNPETWFASARTWAKDADKTKQANTLAGIHARHTLIIVDEAGDIPSGVVAAADATLSTQGDGVPEVHKIILTGNPTRTEGPLWDACTRDRDLYWVKEITGDPDDPNRARRISIEWAREQIRTWGADNPWVLVNVFGKFPPAQADKLLGPDQVQEAMARVIPEVAWIHEPRIMALDVARFGDDRSSLCRRQGNVVFPFKVYRNLDLMELTSQIAFEFGEWEAHALFVDETGVGAGVVDRLRQLGLPVVGVNFSSKPREGRFADKRSEIWYVMSQCVKTVLCLPGDTELVSELTGPSFFFDQRSKMRLESKDDLKKKGLKSPDKSDSLALTYAEPVHVDVYAPSYVKKVSTVHSDYNPYEERI